MSRKKSLEEKKRGPTILVRAERPEYVRIFQDLKEIEEKTGKERTELVFEAIQQYLVNNFGHDKIEQFFIKCLDWNEKGIQFKMREEDRQELKNKPLNIVEYIESKTRNVDETLLFYRKILEEWILFQEDLLEMMPYSRFYSPYFREFLKKQFREELYAYLRSTKIFSNMDEGEVNLDGLREFLPNLVSLPNKTYRSKFTGREKSDSNHNDIPGIQEDLLDLDKELFVFEDLYFQFQEGALSPSEIEDIIKKKDSISLKQTETLFYQILTKKKVRIKAGSGKSITLILKALPRLAEIFDYRGLFEYLWKRHQISEFLQNVLLLQTSDYFAAFVLKFGHQFNRAFLNYNKLMHGFVELYDFLKENKKQDYFRAHNEWFKGFIAKEKMLKEGIREGIEFFSDSKILHLDSEILFLNEYPMRLEEIWKRFSEIPLIKEFLNRGPPKEMQPKLKNFMKEMIDS